MEWLLEVILVVLLAATLFHALRLERALGVLKRDRAALEELANGFNSSTRAAEQGIERLRGAADGAGRQLARQIDTAQSLKDDLQFLAERGDRLADRLEQLVRSGRLLVQEAPRASLPDPIAAPPPAEKRMRSQAERDLLKALRMAR
jgi:chromosome segregation ATPase